MSAPTVKERNRQRLVKAACGKGNVAKQVGEVSYREAVKLG